MKIVIDANIIIASLIKEGRTVEILVNPLLDIYAPEFILEEILKYSNEISIKTHRTEEELRQILNKLFFLITLINMEEFSHLLTEVRTFVPDQKDDVYFALALKLNCPIWSNDKILKNQNKIKIYSTQDLINNFRF